MRGLVWVAPLACVLAACAQEESGAAGEAQNEAVTQAQFVGQPASCEVGAMTIYACRTDSGSALSLCSKEPGKAQLNFNKDGSKVALEGGTFARVGYSGGGEMQMAFDDGPMRYVVFSRIVATDFHPDGTRNHASGDGVVVLKDGEFDSLHVCDQYEEGAAFGEEVEAVFRALPQSDEKFTEETIRGDP